MNADGRRFLLGLLVTISSQGCSPFPKAKIYETTSPTAAQVDYCRAEMYVAEGIEIFPEGFRYHDNFLDDIILFRFTAHTEDLQQVFQQDRVDVSAFTPGNQGHQPSLVGDSGNPSWWDVQGKGYIGGSINLPNARYMEASCVDNRDETWTVYIYWMET